MENNPNAIEPKRSYKEFESDFLAFETAKNNFMKKHADVLSNISVSPTTQNKFGLTFTVVTNGILFHELYDMNT